MRILFFSDVYFPRINGVSTSIRTFRRDLQALGHDVTVVAPAYPGGVETDRGLIRVESRKVPFDPEDRMMRSGSLRALDERLAAGGYDLIHIQTPFVAHYAGLAAARRLSLPCVATYHTFFEEYLHHYLPVAPHPLMRVLARQFSKRQGNAVDSLIVPSRAMHKTLTGYGVRAPMHVLPTGLRLEEFTGGDGNRFRRRNGIPADRRVLLYVGRVAFEKNIDFLLRMLVHVRLRYPDILLVIAGEGPALPRLKALARALLIDPHVLFIGYLDRETELLDCYRAADVFVFASRTETQGLVLLEAMALGVPVIAIAEMGTVDILEPALGSVTALAFEPSFAASVCRVLDAPALRERLAKEGPLHAAQWSGQQQARRLEAIYRSLMR